jgi:hypothetical protein
MRGNDKESIFVVFNQAIKQAPGAIADLKGMSTGDFLIA